MIYDSGLPDRKSKDQNAQERNVKGQKSRIQSQNVKKSEGKKPK